MVVHAYVADSPTWATQIFRDIPQALVHLLRHISVEKALTGKNHNYGSKSEKVCNSQPKFFQKSYRLRQATQFLALPIISLTCTSARRPLTGFTTTASAMPATSESHSCVLGAVTGEKDAKITIRSCLISL